MRNFFTKKGVDNRQVGRFKAVREKAIIANKAKAFIRDMLNKASNKIKNRAVKGMIGIKGMVEITKFDGVAIIMMKFGKRDRRFFNVTAQVVNNFAIVFLRFGTMNNPMFLILSIEEALKKEG